MFILIPFFIYRTEENDYDAKNDPTMKIRWYYEPTPKPVEKERGTTWDDVTMYGLCGLVIGGTVMGILLLFGVI